MVERESYTTKMEFQILQSLKECFRMRIKYFMIFSCMRSMWTSKRRWNWGRILKANICQAEEFRLQSEGDRSHRKVVKQSSTHTQL